MAWEDQIGKLCTFRAKYWTHYGGQMLLMDVRRWDGVLFRDHLHVPYTARFRRLRLMRGDVVRLTGKVNRYYKKHREDRHIPRGMGRMVVMLGITNICSIEVERTDHAI